MFVMVESMRSRMSAMSTTTRIARRRGVRRVGSIGPSAAGVSIGSAASNEAGVTTVRVLHARFQRADAVS